MNNKTTKSIIISIISTLFLTLGLSYAYFANGISGADSFTVFTTVINTLSNISFSSGADTTMTITYEDMLEQDGANDYSAYKMGLSELMASIQNGSGTEETVCTYSVVYIPSKPYYATQDNYNEYTVSGTATTSGGTNTVASFNEVSLDNVTSEIILVDDAKFTVSGADSIGSMNWNLKFKYYNLEADQSNNVKKTISGKVAFKYVKCNGSDDTSELDSVPMAKEPFKAFLEQRFNVYGLSGIHFINTGVPNNIPNENKVDISLNNDGSVYAWYEEMNVYVSATEPGKYVQAPVDSSGLFSGYDGWHSFKELDPKWREIWWTISIREIDLQYLDTSQVRDMSGMFYYCSDLVHLNLEDIDTSNVRNMSWMFANTRFHQEFLNNLDTSSVTNMSYMFFAVSVPSGEEIDLSVLDMRNVEDMSYMFFETDGDVRVSNETPNLTNMEGMFAHSDIDAFRTYKIILDNVDTSHVTNMAFMFAKQGSLAQTTLSLPVFDTSNVTNMKGMFYSCDFLEIDISSFNTSNVTCMDAMFNNSVMLGTIYVGPGWTTNSVVLGSGEITDYDYYFSFDPDYTAHNSSLLFERCTRLPNYIEMNPDITMAQPGLYLSVR